MNEEMSIILTNLQEFQEEVDEDAVQLLKCSYKLFDKNFYLGSTASRTFQMELNKDFINDINWKKVILQYDDDDKFAQVDIDKIDTSARDVYKVDMTDGLVNFDFNYDASLIFEDGSTTVGKILRNMCDIAGVQLATTEFDGSDIEVSWYDNRVTARTYLGMIAELNGGFARINNEGQLELVKFTNTASATYSLENVEDYTIGDHRIITRVVYDNGINKWEFGNENGTTLYLNTSNVFINNEETVETIYNSINGFEFYSIDVKNAPIDRNVLGGSTIIYTDGVNDYPTIYQYDLEYFGSWYGNTKLDIESIKQEETKVMTEEQRYNSLKIEQDRTNAEVRILSEQTTEFAENTSTQINNINQNLNNNYYTKAQAEQLVINSASGLTNTFSEAGGNNVLRNTNFSAKEVLEQGQYYEYWQGNADRIVNESAVNRYSVILKGDLYQTQSVANGPYTLSFYYKVLNPLANCYLKINDGDEVDLTATTYTLFQTGLKDSEGHYITQPINVSDGNIKVEFYTDIPDAIELYDIMLNYGSIKLAYSQNQNEITTSTVNISKGITITSSDSKIKFTANNDGIRTKDEQNNRLSEFTDKGMYNKSMEVETEAKIVGIYRQKVGNQIWDSVI